MSGYLAVAYTGVTAVLLHPLRSAVTTACLVAVFVPWLTCFALAEGVRGDAEAAVRFGADLYVSADVFGQSGPVPLALADEVRRIDGVTAVTPRIVGPITLGKDNESAVLVGVPLEAAPAGVDFVRGRLPRAAPRHELAVGSELARRLRLDVGSRLPPFYRSDEGERVSEVVGVFDAGVSIWQARLVLTTFDTAAAIFNRRGLATDLLVYTRPGYEERVAVELARRRLRVTTRGDLAALLPQGMLHRQGIFNLHFAVAMVIGLLAVLVTSGVGLPERRREVGILKATGWQTDEVLLRALAESVVLAVGGAALSVVLAFVWLAWLNGYGVAALFVEGAGVAPGFAVPYRLGPVPALLAVALSVVVVLAGTLYATWRAAVAPPAEVMR